MLVIFTALISGSSIFINSFGVKGIDSTVFTFLKNIIVSIFLFAIILGFREIKNIKKLQGKDWVSLIIIGLIGGSIPFVLFFRGLQLTSGAGGSFIHKTMFVVVAILAIIFLKEKITKKAFIPACLLLIGSFVLLKVNSFEFNDGALLVAIATIFWAVENVISKHVLKTIEPKVLAFGRLFFGSFFVLIFMLVTKKISLVYSLNFQQFSWIAISTPFLLLYVITWYTGLKHIKVTTATSILLLGSPVTSLLSYLFLGTELSLMQALGMLLTVVGTILMILFLEKKPYSEPIISTA